MRNAAANARRRRSKLGVSSPATRRWQQLEAARGKLSPLEYRRARHAISEIARTAAAADGDESGRLARRLAN